ncbi:hypothetical protein GTA08_BOTSDO10195 [Neofusicoccum parvum]|uniref:Uncharacterized protein n=1 Tax=Neofusicoccum parvum TaxID=310453 RepID=A0ACB5SH03_9PEZI|nr:hypothetical protein GTA08_BOTSDO10195 [Neofusicoccum parvum]
MSASPPPPPPSFPAAFVVRDSAVPPRWSQHVAFSSKCSISFNCATGDTVVRHLDHPDDPSWRVVFPIFSQVRRLLPCHHCRDGPHLCDDGFPCIACQYQHRPCAPREVLLSPAEAVNGDAEMQQAADDAALIRADYAGTSTLHTQCLVGLTHDDHVVEDSPQESSAAPQHRSARPPNNRSRVSNLQSPLSAKSPSTVISAAPRTPSPPENSELRRSTRLRGLKRKPEDTPVQPLSKKVAHEDRMGHLRRLTARLVDRNVIIGYSMQKDQPPPWVDLGGLELTMGEISVFLLNLAHRPEGAMRLVNNGWTPHSLCGYHNWARGYRGETRHRGDKSEGAIRSTFTKSIQRTMRLATGCDTWLQTHHRMVPTADLSTAAWEPLVDRPPTHSLRAMGADIIRWLPEPHSLNLTRAVRFAVEHPEIPDEALQFPIHVRSVVENLPGGFRSRAAESDGPDDNLDQTILAHWKEYHELHRQSGV